MPSFYDDECDMVVVSSTLVTVSLRAALTGADLDARRTVYEVGIGIFVD